MVEWFDITSLDECLKEYYGFDSHHFCCLSFSFCLFVGTLTRCHTAYVDRTCSKYVCVIFLTFLWLMRVRTLFTDVGWNPRDELYATYATFNANNNLRTMGDCSRRENMQAWISTICNVAQSVHCGEREYGGDLWVEKRNYRTKLSWPLNSKHQLLPRELPWLSIPLEEYVSPLYCRCNCSLFETGREYHDDNLALVSAEAWGRYDQW